MIKTMRIIKTLSIVLTILIIGCKKENPESAFPPNTENGANTFLFRINRGKVINSQVGYLPTKPRIYIFYNHKDPIYGDYLFTITAGKLYLEENKFVTIHLHYLPKCGTYKLAQYISTKNDDYAYFDDFSSVDLSYYTDVSNTGNLNITKLDTINHIISGDFTFKARQWCLDDNCNEIITVDGQFDVKYKPGESVNYY